MLVAKKKNRSTRDFRAEMIALQREVFLENQTRINRAVYGYTAAYRRYDQAYQKGVKTFERVSSFTELITLVLAADIVYVGDYHTLEQSQRTVVRLLRHLPLDVQPTLAVEFVLGRYQSALDEYIAGRSKDQTFLRRIKHDPGGVFGAWEHFRPMFEFARSHKLPMIGIDSWHENPRTSLKERDAYAARRIVDAMERRPDKKTIIHIGELHVAPGHLPAVVDHELARRGLAPRQKLVIYQNCEEIYWRLEENRLEHDVEVVVVRPGELCVINTPPIICQQSFLNWLDNEDELFAGGGQKGDADDGATEKIFKEYVEIISQVLDIEVGDALDDVVVSSVIDVHFLEILRHRGRFGRKELEEIRRQVLRSESYFIPKAKMVYLGKLSVNHAAEEASHFLRHLSGGDEEPRYLVDAFYCRVLNEAVGFLGSKLVNHKRKCPHERDFTRMIKEHKSGAERHDPFIVELAHYVVQHRRMEKGLRTRGLRDVYSSDVDMFNAVTHALGYMLGDRLYYGLIGGEVTKTDVRDLFFEQFEEEGAALSTYLSLVGRLESVKIPTRVQ